MVISTFIKKTVVGIATGLEAINKQEDNIIPKAYFPATISFSVPLDTHGEIDWDGSPGGNRQCDFTLRFF